MGVDHLVLGAIIRRLSVAVAEAACLEVGAAVGGDHAVPGSTRRSERSKVLASLDTVHEESRLVQKVLRP